MAHATDSSLLSIEESESLPSLLLQKETDKSSNEKSFKVVTPDPGFCIKTKNAYEKKIFINICSTSEMLGPKPMTDEALIKLLNSDDPSDFRVPMSIGEPHTENDKNGKESIATDIMINSDYLRTLQSSDVHMGFFVTVAIEGCENKYNWQLSREWIMLRNRKSVGQLHPHHIRTKLKPLILEMENSKEISNKQKPSNTKNCKAGKGSEPKYTIIQEPESGYPEFLVAEIHLPQLLSAASFTLDVGEDRILLETRSKSVFLDIYIPYLLIQDECVAQFNVKTKILTMTMPVVPEAFVSTH